MRGAIFDDVESRFFDLTGILVRRGSFFQYHVCIFHRTVAHAQASGRLRLLRIRQALHPEDLTGPRARCPSHRRQLLAMGKGSGEGLKL